MLLGFGFSDIVMSEMLLYSGGTDAVMSRKVLEYAESDVVISRKATLSLHNPIKYILVVFVHFQCSEIIVAFGFRMLLLVKLLLLHIHANMYITTPLVYTCTDVYN